MELVALLVVVVAAWWFFSCSTKPAPSMQRNAPSERDLKVAPIGKSPDEKLVDSLEALREAIREKAVTQNQALRDKLEDANERLAAAMGLATELGVISAVTKIADEMEHWHSWSKHDSYDFSQVLVDGLGYMNGSQTQDNRSETTVNEFVFNGARYRMSVANEHYGFEGTNLYADLILEFFDGTKFLPVFRADISKNVIRDFAQWHVFNVTTIELGTWIQDIVALEELFIARRERDDLSRQLEYKLPKVKNLKRQDANDV